MLNSSAVTFFTLSAYFDIGLSRYLLFTFLLLFYLLTLCSNLLLIVLICVNRSLHEPMYVFLCSLFVNELYGSTGLFPLMLSQILSDVHTVSRFFCFLQIFCLYTYAAMEFSILAVMSYDRYLAICRPLQYNAQMTQSKMLVLISLTWLYPFVATGVLIFLSDSQPLCGNVVSKVYCDNYSVVKLSCGDTTVNNAYGMLFMVSVMCVALLTVYSYFKILQVCFSGCKQSRQKALSTCTPHLASLANFSYACFFEVVQNRFDMEHVPNVVRVVLSLYWLSCQPLLNPLLYGLNLTKIRIICKGLLHEKHPILKL